MLKIEDIIFWLIISLIVGIAIWEIVGAPTDTAALISTALYVASSKILLWKDIFSIDKKSGVGFEKVKSSFSKIEKELKEINHKLNRK